MGATAKFATAGKTRPKKDLGLIAMSYGNVYVASVAFGAKDTQTVRAMQEAASYDGVSLIIAYAHCIAHGYDMSSGLRQQKQRCKPATGRCTATTRASWAPAEPALELDSGERTMSLADFMASETRFRITDQHDHDHYQKMVAEAEHWVERRFDLLKRMASTNAAE